jgi:hypothetical protein
MSLDPYPTEEELKTVKEWPYTDIPGLFEYIHGLWMYDYWKQRGNIISISTGGWSGNEDLIHALQDNFMVWSLAWVSSRRGGHYVFEVRNIE